MIDDLLKRDAVTRYDHVDEYQRRAIAEEQPEGDYVAYDDYAALLSRLDAVENERGEAFQMYVDANEARIDAEAALATARRDALEEAANVADGHDFGFTFATAADATARAIAKQIRALAAQEGEG